MEDIEEMSEMKHSETENGDADRAETGAGEPKSPGGRTLPPVLATAKRRPSKTVISTLVLPAKTRFFFVRLLNSPIRRLSRTQWK
jgi:hypothetical protein